MKKINNYLLTLISAVGICSFAIAASPFPTQDDIRTVALWQMDADVGGYVLDVNSNRANDLRLGAAADGYAEATRPEISTFSQTGTNSLYFDGDPDLEARTIGAWQGFGTLKIEALFYPTDGAGVNVIAKRGSTWFIQIGNSVLQFYTYDSGGAADLLVSSEQVVLNQWNYVVAEIDIDGNKTLNLNGNIDTKTFAPLRRLTGDIVISEKHASDRAFSGYIDEIKISAPTVDVVRPKDDVFTKGLWYFDSIDNQTVYDENEIRDNNLEKQAGNDITLVDGVIGNAAYFDGTNFLESPTGWPVYNSAGVEFWFKADSTGGTRVLATAINRWVVQLGNDAVQFIVWDSSNSAKTISFTSSVKVGYWQYVRAWVDVDGNMTFELDGEVKTDTLANPPIRPISTQMLVGAHTTSGRNFIGAIDELRVFTPSSQQRWSDDWKKPYADDWGVKGLWHFDSIEEFFGNFATPDDNSANSQRYNYLTLYHGGSPAAAGQGPVLVSGDNPFDDEDFGNALSFDDLYAQDLRATFNLETNNLRFEAWIKANGEYPGTVSYNDYGIFGQSNRIYAVLRIQRTSVPDNRSFFVVRTYDADGNHNDWSTSTLESLGIDKNDWVHFAVNFYNGEIVIEANGQPIRTGVIATNTLNPAGASTFTVGSRHGSNYFWGLIDEVRLSEAVVSTPECGFWGYSPADLNKDCYVDLEDLDILVSQWLYGTE